ncbi:Orotidine 5'-phosphate decarboxylase [Acidisarcina polymorpha]|uniref:Orotidine 5'-phosphate decarboxylase n=1 Tax=Acidisarcina polymorpha TaxID=2211140 RepID=A0A2Z5G5V3_9BACT|nr:orotidine-5'-phosphate decarboxylase [Acidisarcina polymorpha]AXC14623.1 Orotidine 5'-phosphate decarboxylase [Acidisarcina polymorpha]
MHDQEPSAPLRTVATSHTLPKSREARKKLIVALDFPTAPAALALLDRLEGSCEWFKVGLELYLNAGNGIVETILSRGHSVFLDLKLHDIPNTVGGAIRSVAPLGITMLTVHAFGGPAMLTAASDAAASSPNPLTLLAVTVLTSMDNFQLESIGITETPANQVLRLATVAQACGIPGFVCSPQEAAQLRARFPQNTIVSPGIRPSGAAKGDQARIATPANALAAGADYLVVGRPITQAADPAAAARAILDEMSVGLAEAD